MLVSYLVFFLSGLATGLMDMNREFVDKCDATAIILTVESDKSLFQSSMNLSDVEDVKAKETATISIMSAIAGNGDEKKNVAIFGINKDEFIMPQKNITTIVVTHDTRLIGYCDKVYQMTDGVLKLDRKE